MSTRVRPFAQVDVFSAQPYRGNPVAVILDGDGLSDDEMRRIAQWTNLSETTFVLPATTPGADYRLRIFTPGGELPFAGHPTLGSAHAWLQHSGHQVVGGRIVQECAAGLVTLQVSTNQQGERALSFEAPPTVRTGPLSDSRLARTIAALGIPASAVVAHEWVDNGPGWTAIRLNTAAEVLELTPTFNPDTDLMVGVIGAYPAGSDSDFEVRAFAPAAGVYEDPVTGSLNASIAQWLVRSGAVTSGYTASQGTAMGRSGRIDVALDKSGSVWIGGATTTCILGTITA